MRLTIRNSDGTVSQPMNLDWSAALDKLAAYEDTGYEPDEIDFCLSGAISPQEAKERYEAHKKRYDEWFAWKQAEEQGRLVILPCKVGDKVFRVVPKCIGPYIQCPFEGGHGLDRCYNCDAFIKEESFCFSMFEDIGRTVFLTREEAEAAMKKEET